MAEIKTAEGSMRPAGWARERLAPGALEYPIPVLANTLDVPDAVAVKTDDALTSTLLALVVIPAICYL